MSFSARALLDDPQALSPWLRAELLGYLRCSEDVREAVRDRLREDPSFTDWCDLLDEIEIHLIPVLLGDGRPLFEQLGAQHRELDRLAVRTGEGGVTHLRYRFLSRSTR